jgi:CPA2 family monovalent cation:H+ antiporter-2
VSVLLAKLRLPTVVGLLVAGALLGPHGLGLVARAEAIETLAEIGVLLLLFTIGLEFSLARIKHIFRRVALGGLVSPRERTWGGDSELIVVVGAEKAK